MAGSDLVRQLAGCELTTAEIHYFLPDYPSLLQLFIWQDYDEAPDYPALRLFLDHWHAQIEGTVHSVRVAHRKDLGPVQWRCVDGSGQFDVGHEATKMIFQLFEVGKKGAGRALAEGEFPHRSAALDWALDWLRQSGADGHHLISSTDGTFSAALVRTDSGQWYAIGQ